MMPRVTARSTSAVVRGARCLRADRRSPIPAPEAPTPAPSLDALAARYVELALAFDKHDEDYVDALLRPAGVAAQRGRPRP